MIENLLTCSHRMPCTSPVPQNSHVRHNAAAKFKVFGASGNLT